MNNNKRPGIFKGFGLYILIFAIAIAVLTAYQGTGFKNGGETEELEFSEFVNYLKNEEVKSVKVSESARSYEGTLKNGKAFVSYAPTAYDMAVVSENYIIPQSSGGLEVISVKPSTWSGIMSWLPTILMVGVMIFFWVSFMKKSGAGGQGVMSFGRSRARMVKDGDHKVTFDDVAGLDEEKAELQEIVDFLKDPKKYTDLGARIPKGILLVGSPGTGKTYISKAVAGEAGVPFFSISGSDFVEMFVGVGASRVRDLFSDAKKNAPCIVFIDEIDAVGRRRGAGIGGGNDEREQTLNQLLVELDGFGANEGIIVLAATNRPDVLDPAILRPGRFDRQVVIGIPDIKGREAVFKVYAKGKPLDENVDLKVLARRTPGFTPADIENMMNEAALLTARRNGSIIHMDDLEESITRVIAGPEKKSRVISDKEKRLTAYHEAGHAVLHRTVPGADPVHQVTIMPRGMAGGFTMSLPEEDRYYITKTDMEHEIMILLGGRIAESIVLGDISTGASNDLERATKTARDMVTKYGMSENIGPINYSDSDEVFLGRDFTSKQNFSEQLASKIDSEVRRIIDDAYQQAEALLKGHRTELERVAEALIELETLDGEEFEAVFTGSKTLAEIKSASETEQKLRKEANEREAAEAEKRRKAEKKIDSDTAGFIRRELSKGKRIAVMDDKGKVHILGEDAPETERETEQTDEYECEGRHDSAHQDNSKGDNEQ